MKNIIYIICGIIIIILIWTCCSILFTDVIVPNPWAVLQKIVLLLISGKIYYDLCLTLIRTLFGFTLAVLMGTVIGIITGSLMKYEKIFFIPVLFLQGAPPLLWIIPLMLILGTNGLTPTAVVFLVILPLVIIQIQEGTKSISQKMWDMFYVYANSKRMIIIELILPHLTPYFKSIFILGIVLGLKSSIMGEWFGAKNGIGRIINEYFYTFNMKSFYAISAIFLFLVAAAGYLTEKIMKIVFTKKKSRISRITSQNHPAIMTSTDQNYHKYLSIKNLSFSYKKDLILNNINLELSANQIMVLTGKSGCGKTTLAKNMIGLLKPDSGQIIRPKKICLIFQDDIFLDHLDCFGNASLPGRWKKIPHLEDITIYYLEKCGLKKYIHYFPEQLSGGMKKRLTFARALVLNPEFIIMDEPFSNLHKEARIELWELYFSFLDKNQIPAVIITHYPEELQDKPVIFYELKNKELIKVSY